MNDTLNEKPHPKCLYCNKFGHDIPEYINATWEEHNLEPDSEGYPIPVDPPVEITDEMIRAWIWENEGTINNANGHIACTDCYIAIGQPASSKGWVAP